MSPAEHLSRQTVAGLAFASLLLLSTAPPSSAATVGPNNRDYRTIAAALNGAPAGESIIVDPGIYSEPRLTVSGRTLQSREPTQPGGTVIQNTDGRAVIQAANATIEGFTITGGNNAGGHGGGVSVAGGEVVLRHLIILQNTAGSGGGVGGITGGADLTIENCTIRNNSASARGGGVEGVPGSTTITNSVITTNVVNNGGPAGIGSGGGVFLPSFSSALIKNTQITDNTVLGLRAGLGGGIFTNAHAILSAVTLQTNRAIDGTTRSTGGGLYISRQGSTNIYGGTYSGNSAGRGGGVYVASGTSVVSLGAAISGNTATDPAPSGGGVYCDAPIQTISGTVSGNMPDEVVGCVAAPDIGTTRTEADGENSGNTNDPVNTRTGALYNQYDPDIHLRGPMALFFARYYSSAFKQVGLFANLGDNWRHNFDWRLTFIDGTIHIVDDRGRTIQFAQNGVAWDLIGKTDVVYQLAENGGLYTLLEPRNQRSYGFSAAGLLLSISDGRGNVHTLSYANGPLTQVSDGLGRELNFAYDNTGRITRVDDGLGRSVEFTYTGSYLTGVNDLNGEDTVYTYSTASPNLTNWGLFTTMVRPEGNTPFEHRYWFVDRRSSSELDSNGHQTIFRYITPTETTITDPLGNVRTHTHSATGELSGSTDNANRNIAIGSDATGRRNSITDRMGDVTTMTYHAPSGKLASRTHPDGATTSYTYEARAIGANTVYDLTGKTHADQSTESYEYDAVGNLTSHIDRMGDPATYTYNPSGQLLTATNRLGGVHAFTYNADATMATSADPAENQTSYAYDAFRRLNRITRADGSTVEYTYDASDRPLSTNDERGNLTSLTYDLNGNVTSIVDPLLKVVSFAYDGNDRLLSVTDALTGISSRTYDQLGRVETAIDPLGNVTTYGYDLHNRLTSVTDPLAEVWSRSYNLEGIVASHTDPLLKTTNYLSDKLGRITEISSPLGNTIKLDYDSMGRVSSTTDALDQVTTFSRDARGLRSAVTLPGGAISASYDRNELGQITQVTDPNGHRWTRSYDHSGRLTSRADPLLRTKGVSYDNRNRLSVFTYPGGSGTHARSYDLAGNLTGISYSDGTTLGFDYDANNRLTTANSGGPDDVTRSFDSNGRIEDSNGIGVSRDLNGRITSMLLAPGKEIIYEYDANGQLTTLTDWAAAVITFSYDAAGRLLGIERPNGVDTANTWDDDSRLIGVSESGHSSIVLVRDGNGQITSATRNVPEAGSAPAGADRNYAVDAAAQIDGASYDDLGRLTANGTNTYTWDLASRLTSYSAGGNVVSNTYDALGRRTSRAAGGLTRGYLWNDALALPSISIESQGGAILRYYVHTPGGDLLYSVDAATSARQFYHYDEMGNTLFVTDEGGAVVASYAYTPYGELTSSSGVLDNPFAWQGRIGGMNEGDGLYYLRARYYDAVTARFISPDPIEQTDPRSINPYQYAWGNPLVYLDPSGEKPASRQELRRLQRAVTRAENRERIQRLVVEANLELANARDRQLRFTRRALERGTGDNIGVTEETLLSQTAGLAEAEKVLFAEAGLQGVRAAELTIARDRLARAGGGPGMSEIIKSFGLKGGTQDTKFFLLPQSEREGVGEKWLEQISGIAVLSPHWPVQEGERATFLPLKKEDDEPTSDREAQKCPINPDQVEEKEEIQDSVIGDLSPIVVQ